MRKRLMALLAVAAMGMAVMAVPAAAAPADGNGNSFVGEFAATDVPIACTGGDDIELDVSGWFKGREFTGDDNRHVELAVFHQVRTYSNADGDTFVYRDVGPDLVYFDGDGNFVIATTGRPGDAGGEGFSLNGHMVMTLDPNTFDVISVVWHGNEGPTADDQACAAIG
jgi:hypothetical protein